jgi:hypothetical protein
MVNRAADRTPLHVVRLGTTMWWSTVLDQTSGVRLTHGSRAANFSHRVLASTIERDPATADGPVRLLSCNTGACDATAAQNLPDKLGVEVMAPSDMF